MRVFVTGASGWIGSASVTDLLAGGHEVVGLARSEESATVVADLGAEVLRGGLDDLDSLRAGAAAADAVVHLGYHHDFSQMVEAAAIDRAAITAMGDSLPAGCALLIASGTLGLAVGRMATEEDQSDPAAHPRAGNAALALSYAERGILPVVVRFAPTVHGPSDHGFTARLVEIAKEKGVSAYVGDGSNRWPAVHRLDAARLVRLAVEDASHPVLHATAEDGVATRDIAEAIGRRLGLPVESVAAEDAADHFGWLGMFFAADAPASSTLTRDRLGWKPVQPGLVADIDAGCYSAKNAERPRR